jgi:hypothetical protein
MQSIRLAVLEEALPGLVAGSRGPAIFITVSEAVHRANEPDAWGVVSSVRRHVFQN